MKKYVFYTIMVFVFSSCATNTFNVRPLTIKIENENKNLSAISVLYIINVSGMSLDLHNSYSKMVVFEEYYSDENGIVEIPTHLIREEFNREFDVELIFVNLKLNDSILELFETSYTDKSRYAELIDTFSSDLDEETFALINSQYNGSFIHINTYSEDIIKTMGVAKEELANALFIGSQSYTKDKEYILVKLKSTSKK